MYGYRIIDGIAKIDESEACAIRAIFSGYISGMSLREAAGCIILFAAVILVQIPVGSKKKKEIS